MNTQQTAVRLAAVIFALVCLAHLWRLVAHTAVRVGSYDVPLWISAVGAVGSGLLSTWLWSVCKNIGRS